MNPFLSVCESQFLGWGHDSAVECLPSMHKAWVASQLLKNKTKQTKPLANQPKKTPNP
jgi:hypothetical protein